MIAPNRIEAALEQMLPRVQKPGRYVGGELNQIVKPWATTPMRVALAFPDIYDIGLPNLGLAILYDTINNQEEMLAERTYLPWPDMQEEMRREGVPLYSLESKHPIADFDILGVSLPYETLYTNLLCLLDLAGIAIHSKERQRDEPLVLIGGHATFNPEPIADFVDAVVVGEGEDVMLEIARCVQSWKASDEPRDLLLGELAKIWGVYVPSLYSCHYADDGRVTKIESNAEAAPLPVKKRIVATLPPPVTQFIVPNLEVVHNRAVIEIMRGCTRGCRFCQAGMITRPVRERSVEEIVDALGTALDATGFEEVGLLSLSSSDYDEVLKLVRAVRERFGDRRLNISLPSLRIESFSIELMEALQGASRRSGFTLAPEAAAERMREIINKPVATQQVIDTAREIFQRGWHTIKVYFMIGHPSETLEDVQAIADLAKRILSEGRKVLGRKARVHIGVSTFVPKPHTPFQWVPCDSPTQIRDKQRLLHRQLKGPGIKLNTTAVDETMLEAWLTRGDRRLGKVIYTAWKNGASFDAWSEHYRPDVWQRAFSECGLDPDFYTHRDRDTAEVLPWDHIDCVVDKAFLVEDYTWSLRGQTRVDCRNKCFACGILPHFKDIRRDNPGDVWECPEVGRAAKKAGLEKNLPPSSTIP